MKKYLRLALAALAMLLTAAETTAHDDATPVIRAAMETMGVEHLSSITYSGTASYVPFGQTRSISPPWPGRTIAGYTRTIDFKQPASRATGSTMRPPITGGPPRPSSYEQRITPADESWSQQLEIWITPWGFLKGAAATHAVVHVRHVDGKTFQFVSWQSAQKAPSGRSYRLNAWINEQNLVERVETWVDHPLLGDLRVEAFYSGYRDFGGVKVPGRIVQHRAGSQTFEATVVEAVANPPNLAELLAPPATASGAFAGGPAPGPGSSPPEVSSRQLAEGVWRITGGYVSLAIEFPDYVVVLEGGQSEARGLAVIAETKRLFPGKPIRYVWNSHPHFDHAAGLAPFVAEGATIITHENNRAFLERALSAPRSFVGDALARSGRKPTFLAVGERHVMREGARVLEFHHVRDLEHSDGMLIAWLPQEKILFQADFSLPRQEGEPANPFVMTLAENLERLKIDFEHYVGVHAPNPDRIQTRAEFMRAVGRSDSSGAGAGAADPLQSRLTDLERELDRLADASAIKRLQRAYGYYLDQALWDDVANLFAENGSIELGLDGVFVGRKRVREYLYALGGGKAGLSHGELHEVFQLQPVITVAEDGRTAKGRWRAVMMLGQYGRSAVWGEGTYENEYVKEDGVWKIAKVHWYQTYMVPYEGGWARNKDITGGRLLRTPLKPDRPPTVKYDVWPGVYIPPFHYSAREPRSAPREPASDPAIAELERRVQRLRDREDIENLVSRYGYYLDKQQWDRFTDLFAEDSRMEISQRGIYVGKKGIRRALELFGPQNIEPEHLHNHIQMQPVIHVAPDGERAWVRSRALSQLGTFGRVGVWGDSVYENEMVKENGVWKYKSDHLYTTFFAPYEPGWGTGARPTPKVSEKIPPDLPPSEVYESLPEVHIPKFHYGNPVTAAQPQESAEAVAARAPASLRERATEVAARITRLEDENAIENLQRSFGFYTDKALWNEAADLFAEGGTIEVGGSGVYAGKSRVREYLSRQAPAGLQRGMLMNHLQLQPIVTLSPDGRTARGRWKFLAEIGQEPALWGTGTYENEYVKENGVWKIKRLHAFRRMYAPYAEGWAKKAEPNPRPAADLPPDRPPTVVYEPYPATYVPPLHFAHPVADS